MKPGLFRKPEPRERVRKRRRKALASASPAPSAAVLGSLDDLRAAGKGGIDPSGMCGHQGLWYKIFQKSSPGLSMHDVCCFDSSSQREAFKIAGQQQRAMIVIRTHYIIWREQGRARQWLQRM